MNNNYFYHDKPVFGLDIGLSSLKIMQINKTRKKDTVVGYGVTSFGSEVFTDGVLTDPEALAKVSYELFDKHIIGEITTPRTVIAIPASKTFTRSMTLPKLKPKDLAAAVQLEAEQYIPVPIADLYLDYNIVTQTDKETEILAVAVPRKIVDSYLVLTKLLGLEVVAIETTISAAGRLFVQAERSDVPTVLIDLGSLSTDITIYDKGLVVTGTVAGGGDSFSDLIAEKLKVTKQEAHIIKTKYGLGVSKKQKEITDGLKPVLDQLVKEIRRMIRYYEERSNTDKKIGQIVTMGGGANMPGLSEHLTSTLRLPVRMCDPWQHLDFEGLQPPNSVEKSMYVTVAGLALVNPKEAATA
jgi:type IV pilus assembly protein PilM